MIPAVIIMLENAIGPHSSFIGSRRDRFIQCNHDDSS